jgi:predicted AlkP superfamily phosphohydrolase/phosphomutase
MSESRVSIVGLDGVPPSLLEAGIEAGRLPTLASLQETGASGLTKSTVPPLSMLAWSTFSTGRRPGNHGIFNFMVKDPDSRGYRLANATMLEQNAPPVWEYLDSLGCPSGIVNVMPSYPPSRTRGYQISDHITTPSGGQFVTPQSLGPTLDSLVDGFDPVLPSDLESDAGAPAIRDYVDRFFATERDNLTVANFLLETFELPFSTVVFSGPDVLLHNLGHLLDESHPAYDASLAAEFRDVPLNLLELYDDFLEEHVERLTDDDVLFVLSDHGHGSIRRTIDLNAWLHRHDYLVLRRHPWTQLKVFGYNYLYRTVERGLRKSGLYHWLKRSVARSSSSDGTDFARLLTIAQDDIDWAQTTAYTISSDGQIYLDVDESADSADPDQEAAIRAELRRDLTTLEDPTTGETVVREVLDGNELYEGRFASLAPDLVVVPEPGYEITFPQTMQTRRVFRDPEKPSSHTSPRESHGIFIGWGDGLATKSGVTMDLQDFVPTALALLGLPVPTQMDGKVRTDLTYDGLDVSRESYDGRVRATRAARAVGTALADDRNSGGD